MAQPSKTTSAVKVQSSRSISSVRHVRILLNILVIMISIIMTKFDI